MLTGPVCVDALTSSVITGARLTKRKFILTVPCSPGMTALRSAFQPHMVAANRRGSWGTFFESASCNQLSTEYILTYIDMYLNLHEVIHSRRHPYRREQHKVIKRLGLRSYGTARDSACVGPNWQDENCVAGIHFNTPGLIDCPKQSPKMVFVGAGVAAEHSPSPFTPPPTMPPTPSMDPVGAFPELAWMDEAAARGEDVVYLNMGSMFLWQPDEFDACIEGFKAAHKRLNGRVRFLFKINRPPQSRSSTAKTASNTTPEKEKENTAERELSIEDLDLTLPPFIRLTHWISNQTAVYTHRALKAFIHHGGGNSFNEAVHFAVPQLVLSQWLDTHEYASYAQKFGLGLRSEHPPSVQACDLEAKILELLGPRWAEFKATCQAWALRSELGGGPAAAARIVLFHAQLCAAEAGARRKQSGDGSGSGSGSSTETELTPPLSPEQVSGFGKDVKEIAIS